LLISAIQYLLFCHDKKWKKPMDPEIIFGPLLKANQPVGRKTIYFVRHGESTWNDTFNKGHHRSTLVFVLGFIPGLIKAVGYEIYLLLSGKLDRCLVSLCRVFVSLYDLLPFFLCSQYCTLASPYIFNE